MGLEPRIATLPPKKLAGVSIGMSLVNNRTFELWSSVMPKLIKMGYKTSDDKYSLQVYPKSYFDSFNPLTEFVKWALIEIDENTDVPDGMELFII